MNKEETSPEQPKTRWWIALDWFQQNHRSISPLVQACLCPSCAKTLSQEAEKESTDAVFASVRDCCSHAPGFINDRLPILESVFRLFLANGNQPLETGELGKKLSDLRGGDPYRTMPEILLRLLKNDCYYGLQEVKK